MEQLINFFGRFHPLVVHLPIGSIILAFLLDALALSKKYRRLRNGVQPALLFGSFFSMVSVITGYCLSLEGGYDDSILSRHQYAGIATVIFSFTLYFLRANKKILNLERKRSKPVRFILFIPLMILLTMTGHWGGSLTHGDEFITAFSFYGNDKPQDAMARIQTIPQPDEAILYQDVIQPILESKCYSCHSSKKQKGDLRLDGTEFILQGGKNGSVITKGLADSSALFSRMMLPLEDEHHMPPNEKPQPGAVELDLIRLWINEGAAFDKKIRELHEAAKANEFVTLLIESAQKKNWMPEEEVAAADEKAIIELRAVGAIVLPVSGDNNYLSVNFGNVRSLDKNKLTALQQIKDQLISLRFSYCNFEDNDISSLKDLHHLTWLYLDHTNVSDTMLTQVGPLPALKYLNLVFTPVSDTSIPVYSKLSSLEQLFLFETRVTGESIQKIQQQNPSLKIDVGNFQLPKLASDTIIYKKKS